MVFVDFFVSSFYSYTLSAFIYSYFLDVVYVAEIVLIFYIFSVLGEDFIDCDTVDLGYWEMDLVTFFKFFYSFFVLLVIISSALIPLAPFAWGVLIVV